jgi:hypothetical protein
LTDPAAEISMAGCSSVYGSHVRSEDEGSSTIDALLMKVPEAAALLGLSRAKLHAFGGRSPA